MQFAYFSNFDQFPDLSLAEVMCQFAGQNVRDLVLDDAMLLRLIGEPDFAAELQSALQVSGCRLVECHGLRGRDYDLDCVGSERRKNLVQAQIQGMTLAKSYGAANYVLHLGAYECYTAHHPVLADCRNLSVQTLEQLLPTAERLQINIALENSFEPTNTPDEVLYLLHYFNHPNLWCCFDVGHANVMAATAGKEPQKMDPRIVYAWENHLIFEPDALGKLAPYIVTCHLHDNDGYQDLHLLPQAPGGTVDWPQMLHRIVKICPHLHSLQSEVKQYAGKFSVALMCQCYQKLLAF